MKNLCAYLKVDFKRSFCSWRFLLAIVLIVGTLLSAGPLEAVKEENVFNMFYGVMYGISSQLLLIGGAMTFSDSVCEDMEHRYIMQQIIRGDGRKYVMARLITLFLVTMSVVALGIIFYSLILHLRLPWADVSSSQYDDCLTAGGFRIFLKQKWYVAYYICYGLQTGMLPGILAVWAAYLSMYIANRMLVLASPMLMYYFMDYLMGWLWKNNMTLELIFSPVYNLFDNDVAAVLLVAGIAIINIGIVGILMYRKLRRKICG